MKNRSFDKCCILLLCFVFLLGSGSLLASGSTDLGSIDFPNSGSAEAQRDFIDGVLLLHSFEFQDAREAFERAQAIDPDFAMAYWGEAMTHNHPLWRHKAVDKALEALSDYAATPTERATKAPTLRERAYLETLDVLFGEGDKLAQDMAYEAAMKRLKETYPEDLEAQAFYSLSILGTTQGTRDFASYMRAAAEAELVFAANPQHPGAAHYLIHSYDDPVHAPLGLRAAAVYAKIAPAATHAQHMISHIYIALGMWREAGLANEKSLKVSEERAARKGLPKHRRNHHAMHWLQYSYLQEGRSVEAARLLAIMAEDEKAADNRRGDWYLSHMRAGQLVDGGEWTIDLPPAAEGENGGITRFAADALVTALQSLAEGELDGAEAALESLQARVGERSEEGLGERETQRDVDVAAVTALEIEALVAWKSDRGDEAVELLRRAVTLEESLPLEFGPPEITKPSPELLGEVLLDLERAEEATQAFQSALKLAPRRVASLLGLSTAARLSGDSRLAGAAAAELARIRMQADDGTEGASDPTHSEGE